MIEVKGNGNIVTREISVSTFVRLHLGCKGTVELYQGDEEKVIIEADENLLEYCSATNAGRTLYVTTEGNLKRPVYTQCTVKVFCRQLNVLYVRNHGGKVICPNAITLTEPLEIKIQSMGDTELNIAAPAMKVVCQAHGNTVLKGLCEKLEIKNQSHGYLDAAGLKAGDINIKNMAHGNVWLHADTAITIGHYGHGFIHYSGHAVVKDIKQFGHGEVKRMEQPDNALRDQMPV